MAIRNGSLSEVHACELVVGDLILIRNGDKIPADVRFVSVTDLKV